jgi:hypothetical protein
VTLRQIAPHEFCSFLFACPLEQRRLDSISLSEFDGKRFGLRKIGLSIGIFLVCRSCGNIVPSFEDNAVEFPPLIWLARSRPGASARFNDERNVVG